MRLRPQATPSDPPAFLFLSPAVDLTWTARLEGRDADAYDAFVLGSPSGHASQTRAWAPVACAGAAVTSHFMILRDEQQVVGTAMLLRPTAAGVALPWGWVERGPVVSEVAAIGPVTSALAGAALRRGILRLRVMPYWADDDARRVEEALRAIGFHDVQTPDGAHAATLRMDIERKSDVELFAGKSKSQVRWRAKQAEKAGALARPGTRRDWARLREMHRDLMHSQGRGDKSDAWWIALQQFADASDRGGLFACEYDSRVVAAAVILRHGPRATYMLGASVTDKLPFSKSIPPLLAGIRWARDVGCTTFDLGGIPLEDDEDPKRKRIAMFKYDFDKKPVRLVREHARWCASRR